MRDPIFNAMVCVSRWRRTLSIGMRLAFRSAFTALGFIAGATGLFCVVLGAQGFARSEAGSGLLLVFGLFATVLGAGIWTWARRSQAP